MTEICEAAARGVANGTWRLVTCSVCGREVLVEAYADYRYEPYDPGERHGCRIPLPRYLECYCGTAIVEYASGERLNLGTYAAHTHEPEPEPLPTMPASGPTRPVAAREGDAGGIPPSWQVRADAGGVSDAI